jgi:hypothetical protein
MTDSTEALLPDLGCVVNHGFDATGHERRERLEFVGDCPKCGRRVEGWAETEEWTASYGEATGNDWGLVMQEKPARWKHESYGPAAGVCCGLLFVDTFEGMKTYRLSETAD